LFSRTEKPTAPAIWLGTLASSSSSTMKHAFQNVVVAEGFFGSFGHDAFVGFAVDHDLPFAGADRFGARFQGAHLLAFFAVQVLAVFGFFPDRQVPTLRTDEPNRQHGSPGQNQVFANQTHQVVAHHADVVVRAFSPM
jgi:hypothetical protein